MKKFGIMCVTFSVFNKSGTIGKNSLKNMEKNGKPGWKKIKKIKNFFYILKKNIAKI